MNNPHDFHEPRDQSTRRVFNQDDRLAIWGGGGVNLIQIKAGLVYAVYARGKAHCRGQAGMVAETTARSLGDSLPHCSTGCEAD